MIWIFILTIVISFFLIRESYKIEPTDEVTIVMLLFLVMLAPFVNILVSVVILIQVYDYKNPYKVVKILDKIFRIKRNK